MRLNIVSCQVSFVNILSHICLVYVNIFVYLSYFYFLSQIRVPKPKAQLAPLKPNSHKATKPFCLLHLHACTWAPPTCMNFSSPSHLHKQPTPLFCSLPMSNLQAFHPTWIEHSSFLSSPLLHHSHPSLCCHGQLLSLRDSHPTHSSDPDHHHLNRPSPFNVARTHIQGGAGL